MLNRRLAVVTALFVVSLSYACAAARTPTPTVNTITAAQRGVAVLRGLSTSIKSAVDNKRMCGDAPCITKPQAVEALDIIDAAALTLKDTTDHNVYYVVAAALMRIEALPWAGALKSYLDAARAGLLALQSVSTASTNIDAAGVLNLLEIFGPSILALWGRRQTAGLPPPTLDELKAELAADVDALVDSDAEWKLANRT